MRPEPWMRTTLGQCLREPIRNGYSPVCPKLPTGRWLLHLGAVTERGFNSEAVKPAPSGDPGLIGAEVEVGDLLVSRSNTRERVGLSGVYRGTPAPCYYPDLLMRIRPVDDVDVSFLDQVLRSPMGRSYFSRVARGTSGSMVKIDRALLEAFPLFLPSLANQKRIALILAFADETIEKTEAVIEQLKTVKQGLVQELLTQGSEGAIAEVSRISVG
jgi:type I restriction enzyme S subunit